MFRKFSTMINSAVEALAPNQPIQEDFVFHWKSVINFFMENRDTKSPIEETNIPTHLQNMIDILVHEEQLDDSGSTGPCMEYLLHHKLLETLYTIGRADCPPGMKQKVLLFYTSLLSKVRQPLLPHVNVFKAVHKLIRICGEIKASPTEVEEMQFLCTVCAKLKEHPHVVNFFLEESKASLKKSGGGQSSQEQTPTEFGLVDALLNMSHSADSRVAMKCCEGLILITSIPEDTSANAILRQTKFLHEVCNWLNTAYANLPRRIQPERVDAIEARWGIDHVSSSESSFPGHRHVVNFLSLFDYCNMLIKEAHPSIATALTRAIRKQFLEPALRPDLVKDDDDVFIAATSYLTKALQYTDSTLLLNEIGDFLFDVESERDTAQLTSEEDVSSQLARLLIERCDDPSEDVSGVHLKLFNMLLQRPSENIVMQLIGQYVIPRGYYKYHSETHEHIHNSSGSRGNTHNQPESHEATHKSPETYESAHNPSESRENTHTPPESSELAHNHINGPQTYTDDSSTPSSPLSDCELEWSRICDEFVNSGSEENLSVSVHAIVEYYANLVPAQVKSSYQLADTGYDSYLNDAHKQFAEMNLQCSGWSWSVPQKSPGPTGDNDEFFEGPFLRILFGKVAQMTEQSYSYNLLLTSVLANLCLLPNPRIHEYLLNPLIALKPGVTNLSTAFNELLDLVTVHSKNCKDIQAKLIKKRNLLMGIFGEDFSDISADEDRFLGAIIVLEEFCKELAAVAFAKHHILF